MSQPLQPIDVGAVVAALHDQIAKRNNSTTHSAEMRAELYEVLEALHEMELTRVISAHLPIVNTTVLGRIKGLIQKVTRRLLRWYINPIVEQQNMYNDAVMRTMRELIAVYETHPIPPPPAPPSATSHASHTQQLDAQNAATIQAQMAQHEAPLSPHIMALVQLEDRRATTCHVASRWPFPTRHAVDHIANAVHRGQRRGLQWYIDPIVAQMNAHNRATHHTLQHMVEYVIARPTPMNSNEQ